MSGSESEEEAAGGCELLSLSPNREESREKNGEDNIFLSGGIRSIDKISDRLGLIRDSLSTLDPAVPELISFKVEEKVFTVHRIVLERDPQSILFCLANNHFRYSSSSCDGQKKKRRTEDEIHLEEDVNCNTPIVIPGRSAEVFSRLLNFLRGYKNSVSLDWMDTCEREAIMYGLQRSWYSYFPFVSRHCMRIFDEPRGTDSLHSKCLCVVIGNEMEYGQQHLDLSCFGDNVGLGVARCLSKASDSTNLKFDYGMFYCSDGKIRSCDSDSVQRLLSNEKDSDKTLEIRISFDADDSVIRWDRLSSKGQWCIGIRRLPRNEKFRFGIIASPNSRVFIKS